MPTLKRLTTALYGGLIVGWLDVGATSEQERVHSTKHSLGTIRLIFQVILKVKDYE